MPAGLFFFFFLSVLVPDGHVIIGGSSLFIDSRCFVDDWKVSFQYLNLSYGMGVCRLLFAYVTHSVFLHKFAYFQL